MIGNFLISPIKKKIKKQIDYFLFSDDIKKDILLLSFFASNSKTTWKIVISLK